jgi:PAS domain S-box-containing protein
MPNRLPVAHVRSAWVRWGAPVPLLLAATLLTAEIEPIRVRGPFMLFFAVVAVTAVVSGPLPAALAVLLSVLLVNVLFLDPLGASLLADAVNDVGFASVCAVVVALAARATRGERRERAQREWCEVTLRSVGDGVIVTDAERRVLTLNAVAEQLTGWTEGEARQRPITEIFRILHERTRAEVENPIERVCRDGKVVGLANHTVLISRTGRETPIDDSGAPIWSEDGSVVGAVLVFRDITERYEADRQRAALLESERAARTEAQAANRAKDEFLAVLSHELRTPLNAILGWTQVAQASGPTADPSRALEVIERNARRQARLIEDVLDMSRIVSGRLALELEPVDLGHVVEAAIDTVRPLADTKGLKILLDGNCGGTVLGDAQRLQQVIWNLLTNAVKFTPSGGRVHVRMERREPMCAVTVRDTGEGIASEFLPLVFERFRQQDSGITRRHGGLGLGLTIVRHLVELHGGSVSAESRGTGQGASFTVQLPLVEGRAVPPAPPEPHIADLAVPRLAGVRALVVDDEPDSCEMMCEVLERAGAEVRAARSATEALEHLRELEPHILVTDLEMPDEDGYALLKRVRAAGFRLPAIAVTAHSSADDRLRALTAGFSQHVSKPVDAGELQLVISNLVGGSVPFQSRD